ncbi:alpha/beta hydrolase [Shimia ponticola]|uniref:alpha/beta hydrolase n=1 Tax=Shimia ponticola TaxID=2582893 RepID=UPI0011BDFF9B|nr:alpha/beta hydrolase [Shimia ponticola]
MTDWTFDWDDAFDNMGYIPGGQAYPDQWHSAAAQFRAAHPDAQLDLAYGPGDRDRLDLFEPEGTAQGLMIFVHGGYWRLFDKSTWSHLARGALTRGWAVAMPSYPLCPGVSLPEIAPHIAAAIAHASTLVTAPIRLAGHSAGGHLVSRMATSPGLLPEPVAARITGITSISGLHDLRPLALTNMNDDLGLTPDTAAADSPALLTPSNTCPVTAWVGAQERPEFLRQTRLLEENWSRQGQKVRAYYEPGQDHFSVVEGLMTADSPLTSAILD